MSQTELWKALATDLASTAFPNERRFVNVEKENIVKELLAGRDIRVAFDAAQRTPGNASGVTPDDVVHVLKTLAVLWSAFKMVKELREHLAPKDDGDLKEQWKAVLRKDGGLEESVAETVATKQLETLKRLLGDAK